MACWIGVASADHVRDAVPGGFAQLGHGRHDVVESLKRGDWLVYYASRERMGKGALIQAFIAIGRVLSDAPYHAVQAMDFNPFRVDVAYVPNAQPAPIRPLLSGLDLTRDHLDSWGLLVRGPKRRISTEDMRRIAEAMGVISDYLGDEE